MKSVCLKNLALPSRYDIPLLYDLFYLKDGKRKPFLIFSHGFKSFKDWGAFDLIADFFSKKGFVFIKINFSHNGTTPEHPELITDEKRFSENTIEKEVCDLNSIINNLPFMEGIEEKECNFDEIYLLGHSRGGCISIICAAENPAVKKLVTWSAFNDFPATWAKYYDMEEWQKKGYNYRENKLTGRPLPLSYNLYLNYLENEKRFNLKQAVSKIRIPFMVVHGIEDKEIAFEEAIEMKKWNAEIKLNLIPYADHNFGMRHGIEYHRLPEDTAFICRETAEFLRC